ncbi:MAG: hypothetical protein AAB289_03395, partial [Chloroflexota bacterium]
AHSARRMAQQMEGVRLAQSWDRFSPITQYVRGLFLEAESKSQAGEPLLEKNRAPEVPHGEWHRQVSLLP